MYLLAKEAGRQPSEVRILPPPSLPRRSFAPQNGDGIRRGFAEINPPIYAIRVYSEM